VRYEAVNAMLLNEFLKEHRKVEQLKKDFESKLAEQQKQIEALTAGLQKVSGQIELNNLRRKWSLITSEAHYRNRNHSIRSASLNAMVRSSLPVESRIRISPERKLARPCA